MKYKLEVEIDDDALKNSELDPDEYIRREMGWLEDSGINLVDIVAGGDDREAMDGPSSKYVSLDDFVREGRKGVVPRHEIRSGLEWDIAYRGGDRSEPVAGILSSRDGSELARITPNRVRDAFDLRLKGQDPRVFDLFDEALDAAIWHAYSTPAWEKDLAIHELTGREGLYDIGHLVGTDYVVNAFWSDVEPGYINCGVFAVQGERMDILTSGFLNGYTAIEDAVRDLADEFAPSGSSQILFVAYCSQEFDLAAEYREALEEGRLEEPVRIPTNADLNDSRETFYFSFGTAACFPFEKGWVEVRANNREEACEMFSSHFPKRDGLLNCSFVYSEDEWRQTEMSRGGPGQVCHQVINDWGPHSDAPDQDLGDLMKEAKEKAAEKNTHRQQHTQAHKPPELER